MRNSTRNADRTHELYKQAVDWLNSGRSTDNAECKYIIWTQINGLGNRMLSLASTFLYALLTERVLLVELRPEMRDVFCEPFPGSSWQLPLDFPIKDLLWKYGEDSPESHTAMLQNNNITGETSPPLVFFNAVGRHFRMANHLFCDDDQKILQSFNWMVVKSDVYYAASLFLLPLYQSELMLLPKTEPSNYHNSTPVVAKRTSILVLSLSSGFYESTKAMYYEKATVSGEMVAVYQPTNERKQDSRTKLHNQKALAETYLLSYCDKIITTATSTFGYVAHGLAGSKPWVLTKLNSLMAEAEASPACVRSASAEPCLPSPPILQCKRSVSTDPAEVEPYLRHCDDAPPMGLKLYHSL